MALQLGMDHPAPVGAQASSPGAARSLTPGVGASGSASP